MAMAAVATSLLCAETDEIEGIPSLFEDYCFACHGDGESKAHIDLERLTSSTSTFVSDFNAWERIASALESKKMPPQRRRQPADAERASMATWVRNEITRASRLNEGDPGPVVLRRLTRAEYGHTIRDLTGLTVDIERDLPGDAAGGEGFANVGSVQFIQDSTLERYLDAAHRVASHAVIGAGPLTFFDHPGDTGLELSAIDRIDRICRTYGFRSGAGEGAEPYGLERYPRAFYGAWIYHHRVRLGFSELTLDSIATSEGISPRFLAHVLSVLTKESPSSPTSEIVDRWLALPEPDERPLAELEPRVRSACEQIARHMRKLQNDFVKKSSNAEDATVLNEDSIDANGSMGVVAFVRDLPQVSHGEPAPSDRDPIPSLFDNTYNSPERNLFHTRFKYYRNDRFLVEKILPDKERARLDFAWTDLLTSFDYHHGLEQFIAQREARSIQEPEVDARARLAESVSEAISQVRAEHAALRVKLADARPGHLDDALGLAARAWRRPLSDSEKQTLRNFYTLHAHGGADHVRAVRLLIARILVAPAFLYRLELNGHSPATHQKRPPDDGNTVPLTAWELASRLSYFLWSSAPDARLRDAAASGVLLEPSELERQARRLLRDEKAKRFATEFFGQWLGFYGFNRYPRSRCTEIPGVLPRSLRRRCTKKRFISSNTLCVRIAGLETVVFGDFTFLDARLAKHYGFTGKSKQVFQDGVFQLTSGVDQVGRGGVLGLGAVLVSTSAPTPYESGQGAATGCCGESSGLPYLHQPADAGSIPADDILADGKTTRERLEAHRGSPSCNGMSRPQSIRFGFALENFDPIGQWRDTYRDGHAIETSGTLADGTHIADLAGLRSYLLEQAPQIDRTLSRKLLGYALGRSEMLSDRPLHRDDGEGTWTRSGSISDIVAQVVKSKQFRFRRASARSADAHARDGESIRTVNRERLEQETSLSRRQFLRGAGVAFGASTGCHPRPRAPTRANRSRLRQATNRRCGSRAFSFRTASNLSTGGQRGTAHRWSSA